MENGRAVRNDRRLHKVLLGFLTCLIISTVPVKAQQGDNTVWSGLTPVKGPSSAFIDATAFCTTPGSCTTSDDFCVVVNAALNTLPVGGVVDARGINSGLSNSCAGSPFTGAHTIAVPSTVLLPAGTITTSKVWILPNGTKIVGEGAGSSGSSVTMLTASGFLIHGTMLQMGSSSVCPSAGCTGIGIEDLALNGGSSGGTMNGIVNGQSQDMSYVHRVNMYQIGEIGLKVWNSAQNSGPYSDISFDTGSGTVAGGGTVCAQILVSSTRGLHRLNCSSEGSTIPILAVQLDSANNSLSDISVQGFGDGVVVGSSQSASSDVLFNITGGTHVSNVVHLPTGHAVKDISIMGVGNGGNSGSNTIKDEFTTTTLTDPYVAMYALGESISIGGGALAYSRFTTSTSTSANAVTWGSGHSVPSASTSNPCSKGSLFSYATGSTGNLYVCTSSTTWTPF
jgi:hypothetical protein